MKQYEIVILNNSLSMSRDKDIRRAQDIMNAKAAKGWELLQIISPSDLSGCLYEVFVKEIEED